MDPLEKLEHSEQQSLNRKKKKTFSISKSMVGSFFFGIFCFFVFLIFKLPEARIQNYLNAQIRIIAQEQGFSFSSEKIRLSLITGPAIKIYDAELKSFENEQQKIKISFLKIRPSLFSLLSAMKSFSFYAETLEGEISGSFGLSPIQTQINLSLTNINLTSTAILKKFIPLDLRTKIAGDMKINIDLEQQQKTEGQIKLKLQELTLPSQQYAGFNLPKISVASSEFEISIAQGQILIRKFLIGSDIKNDDIVAQISGDGSLESPIERTKINAKASFEISTAVKNNLPLLESLLTPAKTSDGKYIYRFSGPIMAIEAFPGG